MINQNTAILTVLMVILTLSVPRKLFFLPFIVTACFIPADQRIIILGLDFTPLRILIVSGFLRVLLRGEKTKLRLYLFDKLVFVWAITSALFYILHWGNMRALINRSGVLFDVIGLYWLFRLNINSWQDVKMVTKIFAVCSLIIVIFVAMEWSTGDNPFKYLGRVHTEVRESRYRCQASFSHSIIMGLFWATLVPMFIGLVKSGRGSTMLCLAATAACVFMVFSTASSTPLVGLGGALFLLPFFRYRRYGRHAVCLILSALCVLHIVMKAPVWHLIARMRLVGGSTGYHRYRLINEAIEHFHEWALIGTRSTAHWGWGQYDVTNQYIGEAVKGGLLGLILFVAVLVLAVKSIGKYSLLASSRQEQWLAWGLCVALLAHCMSFFGITYFGQIKMLLFLLFAMSGWVYEILVSREFTLSTDQTADACKVANGCIGYHS